MKKLLIVDGNSILNRAYYGIRPLSNKEGLPTNALFGFMIQKSICDKFNINLTLERQINTFNVNTDGRLVDFIDGIIV